jgi:hypothetical protein
MASKDKLVRIDLELATQIKDFARKNEMSFKQASREMAKLNRIRLTNKKIIKEIKF